MLAVGSWTAGDVLTGKRGLARIDAGTSRVQAVTPLPSGALSVAFGSGSLWVARVGSTVVQRIDPRSGRAIAAVRTPRVAALAVAGGSLWMTREGTLHRILVVALASLHDGADSDRLSTVAGRALRRVVVPPLPPGFLHDQPDIGSEATLRQSSASQRPTRTSAGRT